MLRASIGSLGLFVLLLLTGCSIFTHHHKSAFSGDYAPNFHIDVTKIPDAVPKPEPMSKYGNPPTYVACGQRYYVSKSSKGYCEKGIASWYGMKFHKVLTSNRERYDVAKMTAAHKTLPLPTYALVTNLCNGRHVVVRINDRGPFVANRIIDLSYCAAVKLGVTAHGTALVEVRAIDPYHMQTELEGLPKKAPVPISSCPRLYLQMGAFGQRENAERLAEQVRQAISSPVTINQAERNGQVIYRVQIGPLPSIDDSDEIYQCLKAAGLGKPIAVVQ